MAQRFGAPALNLEEVLTVESLVERERHVAVSLFVEITIASERYIYGHTFSSRQWACCCRVHIMITGVLKDRVSLTHSYKLGIDDHFSMIGLITKDSCFMISVVFRKRRENRRIWVYQIRFAQRERCERRS